MLLATTYSGQFNLRQKYKSASSKAQPSSLMIIKKGNLYITTLILTFCSFRRLIHSFCLRTFQLFKLLFLSLRPTKTNKPLFREFQCITKSVEFILSRNKINMICYFFLLSIYWVAVCMKINMIRKIIIIC